jgi:hypothetical protein
MNELTGRPAKYFAVAIALLALMFGGVPEVWSKEKAHAKAQSKVVLENDKVKVTESRYPPGADAPSMLRPGRVVYTVKGGTILRTYPDGKTVKIVTKAGETRWLEAETFSFANVGKSEIVLHSVTPK